MLAGMSTKADPGAGAMSREARSQLLNAEIARLVSHGYSVQNVAGDQAVLSRNKRMGWFWNTVLVLVTAGFWLIYVVYRALNRKTETVIVSVDEHGRLSRRHRG